MRSKVLTKRLLHDRILASCDQTIHRKGLKTLKETETSTTNFKKVVEAAIGQGSAITEEMASLAKGALIMLSRAHRKVVELAYPHHGSAYSDEQIARRMGYHVNSVKSMRHEAISQVQRTLT